MNSSAGRPVVFDLFHTLVDPDDFRPKSFRRLEAAAAVLGVDTATLRAAWDAALPDLVTGRDSVRGLLRRVAHQAGRPARTIDIAPAAETLGRYQELALLHPRSEVIGMLQRLQGRALAVLSNCHDKDVEAWPTSPLARLIEHAAFSTKVGAAKPDAVAYLAVLEMLGADPGDVVFVGNGGDGELVGATRAGIGTVVYFTALDDEYGRYAAAERAGRCAAAHHFAASFVELTELLTSELA